MLQYKVDFSKLQWDQPIKGVKCKIYKHGNKQLRLVVYTKDMPPHWCSKGHYGLILEGEFEIEYENDKIIYKSGDGVFIPEGKEHRHMGKVISEFVKVLFVEDV